MTKELVGILGLLPLLGGSISGYYLFSTGVLLKILIN